MYFKNINPGQLSVPLLTQVHNLYEEQIRNWKIVAQRYRELKHVKNRTVNYPDCSVLLTHNPSRISSATAKVDPQSIGERPCFLCQANRPAEQKSVCWNRYHILINPFPIFEQHFTIAGKEHQPQQLTDERIGDMLFLAQELTDYTLFYNGSGSGASAPDHFHFQAGNRNRMPIEKETAHSEILNGSPQLKIKYYPNELRKILSIESTSPSLLKKAITKVCHFIGQVVPHQPEPLFNLLALYEHNYWKTYIFPRKAHRPTQFFEEGENRIVFSPGAVDFAGMLILPEEKDFFRLDKQMIKNMFTQLTFNQEEFSKLKTYIQNSEVC